MAPKRAVAYILSFELPADEAACIIECDVRRKSYAQVCEALLVHAVRRGLQSAHARGDVAGLPPVFLSVPDSDTVILSLSGSSSRLLAA